MSSSKELTKLQKEGRCRKQQAEEYSWLTNTVRFCRSAKSLKEMKKLATQLWSESNAAKKGHCRKQQAEKYSWLRNTVRVCRELKFAVSVLLMLLVVVLMWLLFLMLLMMLLLNAG